MTTSRTLFLTLLATSALAPLHAQEAPLPDQAEAAPVDPAATHAGATADTAEAVPADEAAAGDLDPLAEDEEYEEEIVVTGQRPRGSVLGDIDPEISLSRRDIRSFGASNLTELLEALAPQTRSGRGRGDGGPVTLVNGRRISSFAEIRGLPPEAIERIDILPEEVALKYGYRADQRVVNFVLRRRFRAITAEVEGGIATAGGRENFEADINYLRLNQNGRWSVDAEYEHSSALFESERSLIQSDPDEPEDDGQFRTLLPQTDQFSLNGTVNRALGDVSATFNASVDASSTDSFLGLPDGGGSDPLMREGETLTGHAGIALNGDLLPWRWSATANYDRSRNESRTETETSLDRAESTSQIASVELVASGPLFDLPAGDVSTSIRLGGEARGLESEALRSGVAQSRELSRERGNIQANLDIPIASRRRAVLSAIGDLSANANVEVEQLSDFGTLRTLGGGLNWSPIPQVDVIVSMTDEDGAPSMQQLGDPTVATPNVRVFDFLRGETVDITRIDGGNPFLLADNRRVWKVGATVKPFGETDITLTANYTTSTIDNPIASFPTATPEIEAAFPDRFVRDTDGRLVSIDSRPVNFERSERSDFRWGINFTKPIGPQPEPRGPGGGFRRGAGDGAGGNPSGGAPGGASAGGRQRGPGGGGRGFGGRGFGGGGGGGRLQLALYHNYRITDRILIREGVPELDLLNGSAVGSRGGQPRHELEFQAGLFKDGMGARINANWQSGTRVDGGLGTGSTGDLFFSDFATINLRLFADLGAQRSLAQRYPWLRGMRISLDVDNLLDSRLEVRDAAGVTPLGYQPALLDPLGRSVSISLRKLFF